MGSSHQNSCDEPMVDHSILDGVIPQTKQPIVHWCGAWVCD